MSPKNPILHVGLTALGWLGLSAAPAVAADPGPVPPSGRAQAAAPAAAPSPSLTVLSLYDGRVLKGKVQADAGGYSVTQRGGTLRLRKDQVEGAFGSIRDAYRFKSARVPPRDPDERLKLAHWCLKQHLLAEAKAELLAVLELSPKNPQIRDMLVNIDSTLARTEIRDDGVRQTRAERAIDDRPAELDPGVFRPGQGPSAANPMGLPMIFDLPPTVAVKRADEFTGRIHPILQHACARCHNESYQGEFQLIQVKNRKSWTPNVARANLDATLRLIDPDSPSRSELLSRSLVPHGPIRQPLFRGANDPDYQRVAAWVNSLRPRAPDGASEPSRFGPSEPSATPAVPPDSEGFAAGRPRPTAAISPTRSPNPAPGGRPRPPDFPNQVSPKPPGQFIAGSGSGTQPYAPPDAEFPVPYMMGGPKPKLEATPGSVPSTIPGAKGPIGPDALPALPPAADEALPRSPAPPADPTSSQGQPQAQSQAPTNKLRKSVKIDPALLEKTLMNRYTPPQQ